MKTPPSSRLTAKRSPASGLRRKSAGGGANAPSSGAWIGRLVGVGPHGEAWLDVPEVGLTAVPASTVVPLAAAQIGREVLVSFAGRNANRRPVVVGVLIDPASPPAPPAKPLDAVVDGERIVITGRKEVVLRCGKASIVLASDGQVIIKGARVLTAASGLHRIKGAAVEIN